ncbi:MAG: choice-of-anchor tandem repeat GloVer-containing protein [Candidatus Tumulicola sp.]
MARSTASPQAGTVKTIYTFPISGKNGSNPVASVIYLKGVLYGTTAIGGAKNRGTVFSVTTSGEETVLHGFRAGGGVNPRAGLLEVNGALYGTTYGSIKQTHGNVFSLTP